MDVNMKKKGIPTAQMGKSYINRRGFKSAGAETPKPVETPKPKFTVNAAEAKAKADQALDSYMKTVKGESFKVSDTGKKSPAPAPASKKQVVKRVKDEGIKVPERKKPELKVAAPLDKTIKTGPEKRKFSKGEIKIMEIMQKGKKKDGTMKEGAQRKIQAVRTKERLAAQKIRNKAERAEKRYEVKSAKAKVKAVRKSFKK